MKRVATDIQKLEPRTLYLLCYGHSLNLAMADTLKSIKCMCDALDVELEISHDIFLYHLNGMHVRSKVAFSI